MKTGILPLSLLAAASVMPLAAQTTATTSHPAAHPATTVHHTTYAGGCITVPTLSPKIPALPSTAPCPKSLYTLTRTPDIKADYLSPLLSPEVRETISSAPTTFSLGYVDVETGTGELVKVSKFVTVKYTGYLADGTKFDSSEDHPNKEPLTFQYGMHKVIQGWDTGFEGMHVGGKRRVFIPYQLAYGDAGRPPVIPAKSELIFDIEVVGQADVEPKRTPPPPRPVPQQVQPTNSVPATNGAKPPANSTPPPASTTPKQ